MAILRTCLNIYVLPGRFGLYNGHKIPLPRCDLLIFKGTGKCTELGVNTRDRLTNIKPLNPELNPICYLLALLGAHHFLHVSRIRVKPLTLRLLMSYIYIYIYIYIYVYMERLFLMFLDHTQRRSTVGRTPLDE